MLIHTVEYDDIEREVTISIYKQGDLITQMVGSVDDGMSQADAKDMVNDLQNADTEDIQNMLKMQSEHGFRGQLHS